MKSRQGFTLIEIMVVMLSTMIVGAMAFHLLFSSSNSIQQRLSESSRTDRLRFFAKAFERDMASRYPADSSDNLVFSPWQDAAEQPFMETRIVSQNLTDDVSMKKVDYVVGPNPSEQGINALLRRERSGDEPTDSDSLQTRSILNLMPYEALVWQATEMTLTDGHRQLNLSLELNDDRFPGHSVVRLFSVCLGKEEVGQ